MLGWQADFNAALPGVERPIKELCGTISHALHKSSAFNGVLLEGVSGTGKTSLALGVVRALRSPHVLVDGKTIGGRNRGDAERQLRKLFENARERATTSENRLAILILDGVDALGKDRRAADTMTELTVLSTLLELLDGLSWSSSPAHEEKHKVMVIATAEDASTLDSSLLLPGRLEHIITLSIPVLSERRTMLKCLVSRVMPPITACLRCEEDEGVVEVVAERLARQTQGFVGADIARLCSEALALALKMEARFTPGQPGASAPSALRMVEELWDEALVRSRPAGLSWSPPEEARFTELLGPEAKDAAEAVKEAVLMPLMFPDALQALGLHRGASGVLIYGPTGTGKSTLARALATEARQYASFMSIECPDVVHRVVGDSERAIARIFTAARQASPCILFLDHIEAVAGVRGFDTSTEQTMDRLLSTLLVEMDGVGSGADVVIVVAATNDKELLDPAILRPGRFDVHVELPLPSREAREAILRSELAKLPLRLDKESDLDTTVQMLAERAEGMSGADLRGVCREAAMLSLRQDVGCTQVEAGHLMTALASTFKA